MALLAATPDISRADAISDLLNGKKVTVSVACSEADSATEVLQLDGSGNLVYTEPTYGNIVFSGSSAGNAFAKFTATVAASTLTVVTTYTKVPGAKTTMTVTVSGNTCSATWTNQGRPLDTSCRATRCAVAASAAGPNNRPPGPKDACLKTVTKPPHNSYIDFTITNNCTDSVTFDYDDCDNDGSATPACKVKATTLAKKGSTLTGSNYKRPPNPRNAR